MTHPRIGAKAARQERQNHNTDNGGTIVIRAFRRLFAVCVALALALSAASGGTAFAGGGGDLQPPKLPSLDIVKHFKTPIGTTPPFRADFRFTITPISVDTSGTPTPYNGANMPAIGDATASFVPGASYSTSGDVNTYTARTADIFADIEWPGVGIYTYEVVEQPGGVTLPPGDSTMTYSLAKYTIQVVIMNTVDAKVLVFQDVLDDGSVPATIEKVDDALFTNVFVKVNPETRQNSTLSVSKTVSGELADLTRFFDYTMTVTAPSLVTGNPIYEAYVIDDASGDPITSPSHGTLNSLNRIEFPSGVPTTFHLQNGQRLVFNETPVGTSYQVTESVEPGYSTSIVVTTNGVRAPLSNGSGTGPQLVGEGPNAADFTNTNQLSPPTGISDPNNTPFVWLIVLGLLMLAAFMAVGIGKRLRSRR